MARQQSGKVIRHCPATAGKARQQAPQRVMHGWLAMSAGSGKERQRETSGLNCLAEDMGKEPKRLM